MKFWLKIVIALSVVVVITFGVWAFFFKEDENVVAFNETSKIIDYKYSLGLNDKVNELKTLDYIGDDNSNKLVNTSEVSIEILRIRKNLISDTIIEIYDENGVVTCYYDSYSVIERTLDSSIARILPYLKYSTISESKNTELKKTINNYYNDLDELKSSFTNVFDCQKNIEGTDIEYEVLLGHYNYLKYNYKKCLNDGAKLIINMISAMKESWGNIKYDTRLALVDSWSRSLAVSSNVDDKMEAFYKYDLHLVKDKLDRYENNENIFTTEYSEYKFLTSYNSLINKHYNVLDNTFGKHNLEKKKMADGENLSEVILDAQEPLIIVLNVIGY